MDTSRISFGEMVAAASGIALFIFLFLPWYEAELQGFSESGSGWEFMSFIDILLLIVALIAVGMAAARAAGVMPPNLPAPPGQIVMAAGAFAILLVLFRLIDVPEPEGVGAAESITGDEVEFSRKIGVFLSLIAAGGIAYGGYTALNERASGAAPGTGAAPPPPPPQPTSPPPASEPPSQPPPA